MISAAPPNKREFLIMKLMEMLNTRWSTIMRQAAQSIQTLTDSDTIKDLVNLLKTNVSVAKSLKASYIYQLRHIFRDMLEVYRAYSQMISQEVAKNGIFLLKVSLKFHSSIYSICSC
jgi:exportin-1